MTRYQASSLALRGRQLPVSGTPPQSCLKGRLQGWRPLVHIGINGCIFLDFYLILNTIFDKQYMEEQLADPGRQAGRSGVLTINLVAKDSEFQGPFDAR
jgi:hypothetical protein